MEILIFELAEQRYAVPLRSVREVVRSVAITPLPTAPAVIEGIINVRGTLVPVFDLRARFGLPPKALEPSDHLIIAWARSRLVALRVDRADWMMDLAPDELQDAATIVPQAEYVDGVAKLPDGLVLIHDLDTFLSDAESEALDEAMADRRAGGQADGRDEGREARRCGTRD